MRLRLGLVAFLSIGGLWAQMAGPTVGFVFDPPTRTIRQMTGSLGSAMLGAAVFSGADRAFIAPGRDYAVVIQGGSASLLSELSVAPSSVVLSPSTVDGAIWSDDGTTAVLFSRAGNWIQVFTGFPDAFSAGDRRDVSSLGRLAAVAAGAGGNRIAVGVTGDTPGVYEIDSSTNTVTRVLDAAEPISVGYGDGGNLYAFDRATNQLVSFDTTSLNTQSVTLAAGDVIAIRPVRDAGGHSVIYAAGRKDRILLTYDAETLAALAAVALPVEPSALQSIGTGAYALNLERSAGDPLWVVGNAATTPALYFVPGVPRIPAHEEGAAK